MERMLQKSAGSDAPAASHDPAAYGIRVSGDRETDARGSIILVVLSIVGIDCMDDGTTPGSLDNPASFFDVHVFVCCNRRPDGHKRGSCAAKGSEALRDYMKARVKESGIPHARVNMAGCLDRCEDGPCLVIYPVGVWYRIESRADVDAIIAQQLGGGGGAEHLRLPAGRSA
jgi:(2Fe-2S) ferredoxin